MSEAMGGILFSFDHKFVKIDAKVINFKKFRQKFD